MFRILCRPVLGVAGAACASHLLCDARARAEEDRECSQQSSSPLMDSIYAGLPDVHSLPISEERAIEASGGHDAYGELTERGVREVRSLLRPGPGDIFADLGSGAARCVIQAASEWPIHRAVGVELSATRHAVGVAALARAPDEVRARVELRHECVLQTASLRDVSMVYCASLLFDDAFMRRLGARLRHLPRLRVIASLRRFPLGALGDGWADDEGNFASDEAVVGASERVEVTWGAARVFLYHRVGPGAATGARLPDAQFLSIAGGN